MPHFFFCDTPDALLTAAYLVLVISRHLLPSKTIGCIEVLQHEAVLDLCIDAEQESNIVFTVKFRGYGNDLVFILNSRIVYGLEHLRVPATGSSFQLFRFKAVDPCSFKNRAKVTFIITLHVVMGLKM